MSSETIITTTWIINHYACIGYITYLFHLKCFALFYREHPCPFKIYPTKNWYLISLYFFLFYYQFLVEQRTSRKIVKYQINFGFTTNKNCSQYKNLIETSAKNC